MRITRPAVEILKNSAKLGLTAVVVPRKFGGMEMDLTSLMGGGRGPVGRRIGRSVAGAHTESEHCRYCCSARRRAERKKKYLPKLASAEMVAAYCLSEPQAGSDALAARTRADLSPDGKFYILNGQKMWITNGGYAGLLYRVCQGSRREITAFLLERAWPGVSTGAEEKKMGLKGSSTTAVYLDNVKVPVENVLGEIGRGHIIAFNILNMGRLLLGAFAHGGCRDALAVSIRYAKDRVAFGKPIAEFGMIQHKLAEMAIRTYVSEEHDIPGGGRHRRTSRQFFVGCAGCGQDHA